MHLYSHSNCSKLVIKRKVHICERQVSVTKDQCPGRPLFVFMIQSLAIPG